MNKVPNIAATLSLVSFGLIFDHTSGVIDGRFFDEPTNGHNVQWPGKITMNAIVRRPVGRRISSMNFIDRPHQDIS